MKQIIDGLTYNTKTAKRIGNYWNRLSEGDFNNLSESLYKTKKGNFFLSGEGGPMTKYSRPVGNMISGGNAIIPIDTTSALIWCENHDIDTDVIEEHFVIEEA